MNPLAWWRTNRHTRHRHAILNHLTNHPNNWHTTLAIHQHTGAPIPTINRVLGQLAATGAIHQLHDLTDRPCQTWYLTGGGHLAIVCELAGAGR